MCGLPRLPAPGVEFQYEVDDCREQGVRGRAVRVSRTDVGSHAEVALNIVDNIARNNQIMACYVKNNIIVLTIIGGDRGSGFGNFRPDQQQASVFDV